MREVLRQQLLSALETIYGSSEEGSENARNSTVDTFLENHPFSVEEFPSQEEATMYTLRLIQGIGKTGSYDPPESSTSFMPESCFPFHDPQVQKDIDAAPRDSRESFKTHMEGLGYIIEDERPLSQSYLKH